MNSHSPSGRTAETRLRESGRNYNAVNTSSAAHGKYQIIPSTWVAHWSDLGCDPVDQANAPRACTKSGGRRPR
jgi:hypothetical protein